jgi:DUF1680 family protein
VTQGYRWRDLAVGRWHPTQGFWADRLETARRVTLPHVLQQLEEHGRLRNFARAAGQLEGEFEGHYSFDDSDVYKALEGIGYHLAMAPDPALEARADAIIDLIAAAQMPDGYLFTWHQLKHPDKRWTDMNSHEMYCGGHLFEGAVAYHEATGKRQLLDVARRLADHYRATFGPDRRHWVDGHEEVGLALVRLADATGDPGYREFAHWHLEERGHGHGHGHVWDLPRFGARYSQDHIPVGDIREAEGHAVRAMYLYSAMTDMAALDGEASYAHAMEQVWHNIVERKLYVTGGIGAVGEYEGFGPDYYLPNENAYCETCAAIGMVFWNHRMNLFTGDARYADLVELELYNGALAGISLTGDRFFYGNPLASNGKVHRSAWFGCSCCPTGVVRFIPQVGRYTYATGPQELAVNQFMAGRADVSVDGRPIRLWQETRYPWVGDVTLSLEMDGAQDFRLLIRKPGWARSCTVTVNGSVIPEPAVERGYLVVARRFQSGDQIRVRLPMPVERVTMPAAVEADRGQLALKRGPVVYCFEETDNAGALDDLRVAPDAVFVTEHQPDVLGGVTTVGVRNPSGGPMPLAVPYYAWDHREAGRMRVFVPG